MQLRERIAAYLRKRQTDPLPQRDPELDAELQRAGQKAKAPHRRAEKR